MNSRDHLPELHARVPLGDTGLTVSPFCIGVTKEEDTVLAAYDLGVNFFFLSADLHWPVYDATRRGLARLFTERQDARQHVVIAVVSYLSDPLFRELQFHEVTEAVPGLEKVDVLVAGAVSAQQDWASRNASLAAARVRKHMGACAVGATFHSRELARDSIVTGSVDLAFVRYSARHPGAQKEVFANLSEIERTSIFSFKSVAGHVPHIKFMQMDRRSFPWWPRISDYYRFALSTPHVQGILASPMTPAELFDIHQGLRAGPLDAEQMNYMVRLCEGGGAAFSAVTSPRSTG